MEGLNAVVVSVFLFVMILGTAAAVSACVGLISASRHRRGLREARRIERQALTDLMKWKQRMNEDEDSPLYKDFRSENEIFGGKAS